MPANVIAHNAHLHSPPTAVTRAQNHCPLSQREGNEHLFAARAILLRRQGLFLQANADYMVLRQLAVQRKKKDAAARAAAEAAGEQPNMVSNTKSSHWERGRS